MQSTEVNINPSYSSIEAVLSGMTASGQYDNLRLILSKNDNRELGQKYLYASRGAFGLVKLVDLEYSENRILIALQDTSTGVIKNVQLDINNPEFRFILISWQDIREILKGEDLNKPIEDELLDFDF